MQSYFGYRRKDRWCGLWSLFCMPVILLSLDISCQERALFGDAGHQDRCPVSELLYRGSSLGGSCFKDESGIPIGDFISQGLNEFPFFSSVIPRDS